MDRAKRSYLYAGLAIFFWSTIPTIFKIGLGELAILPMLTIASVTSSFVLLIIVMSNRKLDLLKKSTLKELLISASLGMLNPFLYYLILLKGYQLLPAQVAQPLNMIWPIVLVFLSVPILRQKIPTKSFVALFISFAGVYIVSSQGQPFNPGRSDVGGVMLATGSSIFWALYFILNIKDKRDESVKLFTNFLFASIYLLITLFLTGKWPTVINIKGIAASAYIGIFEMGLTFFLWLKALKLATTNDKISNLVYIAPCLSIVFVHFILHEHVYYTTPAGLLLIISGIIVQNSKIKRRE